MTTKNWDSAENEATNDFVMWSKIGDFVYGTLVGVKTVKSTLPDRLGEDQKVFEVKVKECSYHKLDESKKLIEAPIVLNEGDIVSVGDRPYISSRMEKVKIGQMFGLKFIEELPSKTKGYNPTKAIKVFTPKDSATGGFLMDSEVIAQIAKEEHGEVGGVGF